MTGRYLSSLVFCLLCGSAIGLNTAATEPAVQIVTVSIPELTAKAKSGDTQAQYWLGRAYQLGEGTPQDYHAAVSWFGIAAQNGNLDAQASLGGLIAEGLGTAQDYGKAFEIYQSAANADHALSQYVLASMIEKGLGTSAPKAKAVIWYEKAAVQGFIKAQTSLGVLYHEGLLIDQNYEKAFAWYQKASEQGDTRAQNNLGILYTKGLGMDQDYAKAAKWYALAAKAGFPQAMTNLGVLYENGFGVPQSDEIAKDWYRKASAGARERRTSSGLPNQAQIQAYLDGPDFNLRAVKAAANTGDAHAQFTLGNMYLNGWRVPQDYVLAYKWMNLSVTDPASDASALRVKLTKRMTNGQLNEAQKLSREWKIAKGN